MERHRFRGDNSGSVDFILYCTRIGTFRASGIRYPSRCSRPLLQAAAGMQVAMLTWTTETMCMNRNGGTDERIQSC